MINYDRPADLTALQAISEAQKLAFSPIAFQASVTLLRLGILKGVADAGEDGVPAHELAERLRVDPYGVRVLLDMGLSIGLVWSRGQRYVLDKMGHFLLHDRMTQINMNFVADVCYEAMGRLKDSVEQRAPLGLARFGDWPTLYPKLMDLPEPARTSWFSFDHFYSTTAYAEALAIVFERKPRHILDIGGNTGLWALACTAHDDGVRVTIADLPEQTRAARTSVAQSPHAARIDLYDVDLLAAEPRLPHGADALWMSQLLDCFSEAQASRVLEVAARAMHPESSLYVLEPLWDRQRHDAAAYSVNATSLYFTCIANGVSRMYRSDDLLRLVREAGLRVEAEHDGLGVGQTLLRCVRAS